MPLMTEVGCDAGGETSRKRSRLDGKSSEGTGDTLGLRNSPNASNPLVLRLDPRGASAASPGLRLLVGHPTLSPTVVASSILRPPGIVSFARSNAPRNVQCIKSLPPLHVEAMLVVAVEPPKPAAGVKMCRQYSAMERRLFAALFGADAPPCVCIAAVSNGQLFWWGLERGGVEVEIDVARVGEEPLPNAQPVHLGSTIGTSPVAVGPVTSLLAVSPCSGEMPESCVHSECQTLQCGLLLVGANGHCRLIALTSAFPEKDFSMPKSATTARAVVFESPSMTMSSAAWPLAALDFFLGGPVAAAVACPGFLVHACAATGSVVSTPLFYQNSDDKQGSEVGSCWCTSLLVPDSRLSAALPLATFALALEYAPSMKCKEKAPTSSSSKVDVLRAQSLVIILGASGEVRCNGNTFHILTRPWYDCGFAFSCRSWQFLRVPLPWQGLLKPHSIYPTVMHWTILKTNLFLLKIL